MKEERREYLADAMDEVRDDFLVDAAGEEKGSERRSLGLLVGVAACIGVLILGDALGWFSHLTGTGETVVQQGTKQDDGNISKLENEQDGVVIPKLENEQDGVTIPKLEIEVPSHWEAASMIGFVIYQGRVYVQYDWIEMTPELRGEYLATVEHSIDEWTPLEKYVELSGSMGGDLYTVPGYAPEFMLALRLESDWALMINNNGITLKTGADLFEDRLHLAGHHTQVQYESRDSWYYSKGIVKTYGPEQAEALTAFVAAINEATCIPESAIPLPEGADNIFDDLEICHLYFTMENGLTVELRCFEGGYLYFEGLRGVCVQIDEAVFEAVCGVWD